MVLLPTAIWRDLLRYREHAGLDEPVFRSRRRATCTEARAERNVTNAVVRAGAPVHLVAATLGRSSIQATGRYLHARPTDSSARYLPV